MGPNHHPTVFLLAMKSGCIILLLVSLAPYALAEVIPGHCPPASGSADVDKRSQLSLEVRPCHTLYGLASDYGSVETAISYRLNDHYRFSIGYEHEKTNKPGQNIKKAAWQQLFMESPSPFGTLFWAFKMEQVEPAGRSVFSWGGGLSRHVHEVLKLTLASKLETSANREGLRSNRHITSLKLSTDLSNRAQLSLLGEYKYNLDTWSAAFYETKLTLVWTGM